MLVGGCVLLFLGVQEVRLASGAKAKARDITCAELGEKGPGDNAHVRMGEFLLCEFSFVYESKEGQSDRYERVWVPAVPLEGEYHRQLRQHVEEKGAAAAADLPMPRDLRVVVKSGRVHNDAELEALAMGDTLEGMVVNRISGLGGEERKILQDSYPGVDFSKVYILEHGRTPAGFGKTAGLLGGGAALVLVPVGLFVLRRRGA